MLIKAQQKFVRTSPRKLRLVADSLRALRSPQQALIYLEHMKKRAAKPLSKAIKQALANATGNLKLPNEGLVIKEIQVGGGPIYKRVRPRSRGLYHSIAKRTSHITVILETKEPGNERMEKQKGRKLKGGTKS